MMAKPRVLLLDEPSLGLAPLVVREIFDVLRRMNERGHDDRRRRAERDARARLGAARVRARDRAASCSAGDAADAAGRRVRAAELPGLLMAQLPAAGRERARVGRDLRLARARDRADPPRDRRAQLRAGRAGDALGVHLLDARSTTAGRSGRRSAPRSRSRSAAASLLEQTVIRPIQNGPLLGIVILTIGLLIAVNGLDTWIWGGAARQFNGPFSTAPIHVGGVAFSKQDIGVIGVSLVTVLLLAAALRAARSSGSACAPRPSTRSRHGLPACACPRCSRSAGASPPRSARSRA